MTTNTHKFKVWDNTLLFQQYEKVMQIQTKIEEVCTGDTEPEDLPMSLVPSDVMYDIAVCYTAMYDKLLKYELLISGYPKQNKTHH